MYQPTVSVVINTHNRASHLKRLLDCLTRQTYELFEVIIVNGPSEDSTEEVIAKYGRAIRTAHCPHVNLCESRNIGVGEASGEIIAFIDDDAVPQDDRWLENAAALFEDPAVGIVGGKVLRINGDIEFRYGTFDIWGDNTVVNEYPKYFDKSEAESYNRGQGCNCFFRMKAMVEAGGFDEYFEYFLDESDLCMRIIQLGYVCRYGENMAVIHEAAVGANRQSEYRKNWYTISRSQGYFIMQASRNSRKTEDERKRIALESIEHWVSDIRWLSENGKITAQESREMIDDLQRGIVEGINDGLASGRKLIDNFPNDKSKFKKYDKTVSDGVMNICLICEGDTVNPVGGVPVYTKALAEGLGAAGHNVFVITRGEEEKLELINGYNICSVVPEAVGMEELAGLPNGQTRIDFSVAVHRKLQQLKRSFHIQILESPIWDSTGVVSSYLEKDIPVVTRLQTPLKMVIETFEKDENADLQFLSELEEGLMAHSDAIISISDCIRSTIEKLYGLSFSQPVYKNYLGFPQASIRTSDRKKNDGKIVVFFVGRLERRKGIDSIIAAIPELMRKHPNLEFHLAGDCGIIDDVIGMTYREKLLRDNPEAPWMNRVKFMGMISEQEKEREFCNCDIFVSPSLYESFGIIFIEAMRVGKPVIGCRVGGMQEVIEDGVTGLLAEPGSAVSFEECLERLVDDADLRQKMGMAAMQRYRQMFTTEKMCRDCESIYRSVIGQFRAASAE